MRRTYKAIFEREIKPDNNFGPAQSTWEEITREWISLEPLQITAQRAEFIDAAQTKTTQKTIATATHSRTMMAVDTSCRMKIEKPDIVDESDPNSDANFRIFNIEQIVNVREQNRELQLLVVENI